MRFDCRRFAFLFSACTVLSGLGCADFSRGPGPKDAATDAPSQTPPVVDLTFETKVYPILLTRCQDCHRAGEKAAHTRLVLTGNARSDRASVVALVVPANPSASILIQRTGGEAHPGGQALPEGTPAYDTITAWIYELELIGQH